MVGVFIAAAALVYQPPATSWRDLIADYRELGLPSPPAGAVIAYRKSGWGTSGSQSYEGFEFNVVVLEGDRRMTRFGERKSMEDSERRDWTVLPPTKEALDAIRRRAGKHGDATADPLFPIQATMLGRADVAAFVKDDQRHSAVFRNSRERFPMDRRRRLILLAWRHWQRAFAEEQGDRRAIVARLEAMLARKWGVDDPARRNLVADMKKTLEPPPRPAAPQHEAIERLLDLRLETFPWPDARRQQRRDWRPYTDEDRIADERCQALLRKGHDAVPALLEHLDDFRVTRSIYEHHREPLSTRSVRVADVVLVILQRMAPAEELAFTMHDRAGRGAEADKAQIHDWLSRIRAKGERDAILAGVFVKDAKEGAEPVRIDQLRIVAEKYPRDFPEMFRRAVRAGGGSLAEDVFAVAIESALPKVEKLAILKEAVEKSNGVTRAQAAAALAKTDREAGLPVFEEELARAGKRPFGYELHTLTLAVAELNVPSYWSALEQAAKRLSPDARVGILTGVAARGIRPSAVPFWSKFLDDDSRGEYRGPCSSDQVISHVVRNLAAEKIARAWGWDVDEPKTPVAWEELRKKVRAEIARRALGK